MNDCLTKVLAVSWTLALGVVACGAENPKMQVFQRDHSTVYLRRFAAGDVLVRSEVFKDPPERDEGFEKYKVVSIIIVGYRNEGGATHILEETVLRNGTLIRDYSRDRILKV